MPNYNHCLRPIFTENIVKTLKRGESINIYGAKGQGRKRLLEDLQSCQFDDMQVLLINMKNYASSYQGFVEALGHEIGEQNSVKFGDLLDKIELTNKDTDRNSIILLYNFDSLLNNKTVHRQYGIRFFDSLNTIKNRSNMVLVCVTEKIHSSSMIYVNRGVKRGSWLNLELKKLPDLNMEEIQTELKRDFPALYMDELNQISNKISVHKYPYHLLTHFVDGLNNREDEATALNIRLDKWQKSFNKDRSIFSYAGLNRLVQRIKNFFGALEIWELLNRVVKLVFYDFPNAIVDIIKHITSKKK